MKVVTELGSQKRRKFNRVELVESEDGNRFVLKSCSLNNTFGCELLVEESNFSFNHANLPKVINLKKTETEIQLKLQYKDGVPLDAYWKKLKGKERKLFLKCFIPTFLQLLNEVHKKGILHNDIRPGNILINNNEFFIIDFGMATRKGQLVDRKTLFSLQYASPELILNKHHLLDETSDLFSFALVLIGLFNNGPVYNNSNPSVLTNLAITYPISLKGVVPKEFVLLLEKMCVKAFFKTSPNRMKESEVNYSLVEAMCRRRIENLPVEWESVLDKWIEPRKWFNLFR